MQAKTYIALNKSEATVEKIAKIAKIPRQHIYEPLKVLEKMGIVQKTIDTPPKYNVLPVKDVAKILMEIRNKQNWELQDKITFLIESLQKDRATETEFLPEKEHTTLLTGCKAFIQKADKTLMNARISFDGIATGELFRRGMFDSGDIHRNALKRGVRYRHIVSKHEKQFLLGDEDLVGDPSWKVRFFPRPSFILVIIDKKEVFISTKAKWTKETSYYWSNNECFLILAQSYFDILWKQSYPRKKQAMKPKHNPSSRNLEPTVIE